MSYQNLKSYLFLLFVLFFSFGNVYALTTDGLFLFRSNEDFASTIDRLKNILDKRGYDFVKVQNVDTGLEKNGYDTYRYKTVFFAKKVKMGKLINKYPELIPYLPLKVTLYEDFDNTILVSLNPKYLQNSYQNKKIRHFLEIWSKDLQAILADTASNK